MNGIHTETIGETVAGDVVTKFLVTTDELVAELWDYGATLIGVQFDGEQLVQRRGTLADYDSPDRAGYMGHTIGRYANRIAGGRFSIDGTEYQVAVNDGPNALHGGQVGFDQALWSGSLVQDAGRVGVRFTHTSPDGDQGFPGNLQASATYWFDGPRMTIEYSATTDVPTIVNMTNHAYWNLAGSGTICDHELSVGAGQVLAVDDDLIPTEPVSVVGTRFDLRNRQRINRGFDHCWVLDGETPSAVMIDPLSGRCMTVVTDQPGLQVYTGDALAVPFRGLALEAQQLPDTPNRPDFGSAILLPGERYRQVTNHEFSRS